MIKERNTDGRLFWKTNLSFSLSHTHTSAFSGLPFNHAQSFIKWHAQCTAHQILDCTGAQDLLRTFFYGMQIYLYRHKPNARHLCTHVEVCEAGTFEKKEGAISPTFYDWLFHTKVFWAAFLYSQFGFVFFWQNNIGAKAAHKMLVKLTPGRSNWSLSSMHVSCPLYLWHTQRLDLRN